MPYNLGKKDLDKSVGHVAEELGHVDMILTKNRITLACSE